MNWDVVVVFMCRPQAHCLGKKQIEMILFALPNSPVNYDFQEI